MAPLSLAPLSKDFVLGKPIKQDDYDESIIYELEKRGHLIITRKRDGWKLFVVKTNGDWRIYTDGINDVTDRLPHCVAELKILNVPDHSLLVCEGVLDRKGKDNFSKVGAILNGRVATDVAIKKQQEVGPIKLMFFDVVFWGCANLSKNGLGIPYACRLTIIQRILRHVPSSLKCLMPPQVLRMSYDKAKKEVVKKGWEGLVLYDAGFKSSFRLDGKEPERPEGCYKRKPIYEDDFIVRSWIGDDEKHPQRVKKVILLQIDWKTKEEFECGELGSFTGKMRQDLFIARYPLVMQVRFEHRYPSGKLRNAIFVRLRPDKRVSDCIAPKNVSAPN